MNPLDNKHRNDLQAILADEHKLQEDTHGVGGVLARLMRRIFFDMNISYAFLEKRINRLVATAKADGSTQSLKHLLNKSNLIRGFARPDQTWRSLVRNIKIMGVARMTLIVKLEWTGPDGEIDPSTASFHSAPPINLGNYEYDDLQEGEQTEKE